MYCHFSAIFHLNAVNLSHESTILNRAPYKLNTGPSNLPGKQKRRTASDFSDTVRLVVLVTLCYKRSYRIVIEGRILAPLTCISTLRQSCFTNASPSSDASQSLMVWMILASRSFLDDGPPTPNYHRTWSCSHHSTFGLACQVQPTPLC